MRREEGVVDAADADESDRRAVMQCDGRVAAAICDRGPGDARRRIGQAVQRDAVAAGLAERGDRVVAATLISAISRSRAAAAAPKRSSVAPATRSMAAAAATGRTPAGVA